MSLTSGGSDDSSGGRGSGQPTHPTKKLPQPLELWRQSRSDGRSTRINPSPTRSTKVSGVSRPFFAALVGGSWLRTDVRRPREGSTMSSVVDTAPTG